MSDGFTVTVINDQMAAAFARFLQERMPEEILTAAYVVTAEIVSELVDRSPELSGAYVGGWSQSLPVLEAMGTSAHVDVFDGPDYYGVQVTNPVEHGVFVEYGVRGRPGANIIAPSIEAARRRLVYGRGPNSLSAAIQRAWAAV